MRSPADQMILEMKSITETVREYPQNAHGGRNDLRPDPIPSRRTTGLHLLSLHDVSPYSILSASARQLASMIFGLAPTVLHRLVPILGFDQHTRRGCGAFFAIQDSHLIVCQAKSAECRIDRQSSAFAGQHPAH